MAKKIAFTPFAIIIGIAIVLQLALIGADCRQTPAKIVRNFVEAYVAIDPQMQDYVCSGLAEKGVVDNFLYKKHEEAARRGFSINYLRHQFTKLHIRAVELSDKAMTYHVQGTTRVCINRPFMIIGKLFRIGQDYPVDEHIHLTRQNGQWRVCGNPFGMNPNA